MCGVLGVVDQPLCSCGWWCVGQQLGSLWQQPRPTLVERAARSCAAAALRCTVVCCDMLCCAVMCGPQHPCHAPASHNNVRHCAPAPDLTPFCAHACVTGLTLLRGLCPLGRLSRRMRTWCAACTSAWLTSTPSTPSMWCLLASSTRFVCCSGCTCMHAATLPSRCKCGRGVHGHNLLALLTNPPSSNQRVCCHICRALLHQLCSTGELGCHTRVSHLLTHTAQLVQECLTGSWLPTPHSAPHTLHPTWV